MVVLVQFSLVKLPKNDQIFNFCQILIKIQSLIRKYRRVFLSKINKRIGTAIRECRVCSMGFTNFKHKSKS